MYSDIFNSQFGFFIKEFGKELILNNTITKAIINESVKGLSSTDNGNYKRIYVKEKLLKGDIIEYQGCFWYVITTPVYKTNYSSAVIQQCNKIVCLWNTDGEGLRCPVILQTGTFTVQTSDVVSTLSGKITLYVQRQGPLEKYLFGTRFLTDYGCAYEIIQVSEEQIGLLKINAVLDSYNSSTDDFVNGVPSGQNPNKLECFDLTHGGGITTATPENLLACQQSPSDNPDNPDNPPDNTATYSVQCIDSTNGNIIKQYIRNDEIGSTVSIVHSDTTLTGYTFDESNPNNVLSAVLEQTDTVLKLYFTPNTVEPAPTPTEAIYYIKYYVEQNNTSTLFQQLERTGTIGEVVSVEEQDKKIINYTFDESNPNNVLSAVLELTGTVLKLYFIPNAVEPNPPDDNTATYSVKCFYVKSYNGTPHLLSEEERTDIINTTVTVTDADRLTRIIGSFYYTYLGDTYPGTITYETLMPQGTELKLFFWFAGEGGTLPQPNMNINDPISMDETGPLNRMCIGPHLYKNKLEAYGFYTNSHYSSVSFTGTKEYYYINHTKYVGNFDFYDVNSTNIDGTVHEFKDKWANTVYLLGWDSAGNCYRWNSNFTITPEVPGIIDFKYDEYLKCWRAKALAPYSGAINVKFELTNPMKNIPSSCTVPIYVEFKENWMDSELYMRSAYRTQDHAYGAPDDRLKMCCNYFTAKYINSASYNNAYVQSNNIQASAYGYQIAGDVWTDNGTHYEIIHTDSGEFINDNYYDYYFSSSPNPGLYYLSLNFRTITPDVDPKIILEKEAISDINGNSDYTGLFFKSLCKPDIQSQVFLTLGLKRELSSPVLTESYIAFNINQNTGYPQVEYGE